MAAMKEAITFRPYSSLDRPCCLDMFDANCPQFFAPNEREDYATFLDSVVSQYQVCAIADRLVGAFGLIGQFSDVGALNWILLDPGVQGSGIGSLIMDRVVVLSQRSAYRRVNIAASHKSAPFFKKFGAEVIKTTPDGWGPGMHRVDMVLKMRGDA